MGRGKARCNRECNCRAKAGYRNIWNYIAYLGVGRVGHESNGKDPCKGRSGARGNGAGGGGARERANEIGEIRFTKGDGRRNPVSPAGFRKRDRTADLPWRQTKQRGKRRTAGGEYRTVGK